MSAFFSRIAQRTNRYIIDVKIKKCTRRAAELWMEYNEQNLAKGFECISVLKELKEMYGAKAINEVCFDESDSAESISTSESWRTLRIAHELFWYSLNHPNPDMRQVPLRAVEEGVFKMTDVIQRKWNSQSTPRATMTIEESVYERFAVCEYQDVYEYFVEYAKNRPEVVQSMLNPSDLRQMEEVGALKAAEKAQGLTLLRAWYIRDLLKEPARLQYLVPHFRGDAGGEDEKEIPLRGYKDWLGVRYPNPEKSIANLPEFLKRVEREMSKVGYYASKAPDVARMARLEREAYKKIAAIHRMTHSRVTNGRWTDLGIDLGWFSAREVKSWLEEMESQKLWTLAFERGMEEWTKLPCPRREVYKTKIDGLVLKETFGASTLVKVKPKTL